MNFGDTAIAWIRTTVPAVVGTILATLAGYGLNFDADTNTAVQVASVGIATGAYYFAVRMLERVHPLFGVLLGATKQPEYRKATS